MQWFSAVADYLKGGSIGQGENLPSGSKFGVSTLGKLVQVSAGLHLKEVQVQVEAGDQRATVQLRANGNVTQRDSGQPMYIATRWRTTWERGAGTWLLRDVQRLDPVSGQSIGVFSAGP